MRSLRSNIKVLAGFFKGVQFDALLKCLSSATSNNTMPTKAFKCCNDLHPKISTAYAGRHAASASLYEMCKCSPNRIHPYSTTQHTAGFADPNSGYASVQRCSSAASPAQPAAMHSTWSNAELWLQGGEVYTCARSLSMHMAACGANSQLSCKHSRSSKPAHAATGGGATAQLVPSQHSADSAFSIATVYRRTINVAKTVAVGLVEGQQLQQQIRSCASLSSGASDIGFTAADDDSDGSSGSRRRRGNCRQDATDDSSSTSGSQSVSGVYTHGNTSSNSSSSDRKTSASRRRQQPDQEQYAKAAATLGVTTGSVNSSSSSGGTHSNRRRRQQATGNDSSASERDKDTNQQYAIDAPQAAIHNMQQEAQSGKQRQQQQARRALLLGIDPDTNGAVAVVAATLLPFAAANSNSNSRGRDVHSSSSGGNGSGSINGCDSQQQQQQLVAFHNAAVAVFDMPTELIPLKKKTKTSPQRYRRRLDILQTIALIKQLIQQQQQEEEEDLVPVHSSSSKDTGSSSNSSNSSSSKVMLRAFLEVSSITPTNGSLAILNQGYSTGAWQAALLAAGFEVSTVHVRQWKKDMGLVRRDKDDSRMLAQQLFSTAGQCQQHITSRKKDHGRAEALLIAAWGCGWSCTPSSSSSSSWSLHQGPLRAALHTDGGMHVLSAGGAEYECHAEGLEGGCGTSLIMPAVAKPPKRAKKVKKPKEPKRKGSGEKNSSETAAAAAAAVALIEHAGTASSSSNSSGEPAMTLVTSARRKKQR